MATSTPKIGRCTRIEFKKKGKETLTLRVVGVNTDALEGKKKLPKPETIDKTERAYFADLHRLVDKIYDAAAELEWTWSRLAEEAGLGYQTVDNLGCRRTKRPQFRTVYRMAEAVGFNIVMEEKPVKKRKPSVKVKAA